MSDDFVIGAYLEFDGGGPEGMFLYRGSLDDCVELAEKSPAISYSGSRRVKSAELLWMPAAKSIWVLPEGSDDGG